MVDHLVHLGVERGRLFVPSGGPATDPIGERYSRLVAGGLIDPVPGADAGPPVLPWRRRLPSRVGEI